MNAMTGRVDFLPEEFGDGRAHLARVIGSMALQHRDIGDIFPAALSEDEWRDILTRIGEPLMAYAAGIDDLKGAATRLSAARVALELFASWFDDFRD